MKQIPILFSTPMVEAILKGRKTMTRRIVKEIEPESKFLPEFKLSGFTFIEPDQFEKPDNEKIASIITCRYGQLGDLLWVRETWCLPSLYDGFEKDYYFKAGFDPTTIENKNASQRWKPSIHMKKEAARIWLQVEEIRVERLQDISEADAKSEGILPAIESSSLFLYYEKYSMKLLAGGAMKTEVIKGEKVRIGASYTGAKTSFRSLWTYINGIESWDFNPWVWVVKFKVLSTTGKPELATCNTQPETIIQ